MRDSEAHISASSLSETSVVEGSFRRSTTYGDSSRKDQSGKSPNDVTK